MVHLVICHHAALYNLRGGGVPKQTKHPTVESVPSENEAVRYGAYVDAEADEKHAPQET
jgi:hypothetical protein